MQILMVDVSLLEIPLSTSFERWPCMFSVYILPFLYSDGQND